MFLAAFATGFSFDLRFGFRVKFDLGLFLFGAVGFWFRQDIDAPNNRRQSQHERHVRDVVHEGIGHDVRTVAARLTENERKNQIAHARAIRHDQRAEHRAFETARAHCFQPPDHEE